MLLGRETLKTTKLLATAFAVCLLAVMHLPAQDTAGNDSAESARQERLQTDESTLTFSDDTAGPAEEDAPEAVSTFSFWDFFRMFLVLGAVIASIYGFFFLLKRMSGQRFQSTQLISILGSQALPGNRSLHLVQVGRQVFFIGSSDNSVNLLSEITDRESLDQISLAASALPGTEGRTFADVFSGIFRRPAEKSASPPEGPGVNVDFIKQQQERLKKLRS